MKKIWMTFFFLCAAWSFAEPIPYFEMRQVVTNTLQGNGVAVAVTGVLLTNANVYTQATNLAAELQSDPDYFLGLATVTHIHWHDHYNPSPCWLDFISEHLSSRDKAGKWIKLTEEITNDPRWPDRYLAETWVLAIADEDDAQRKWKKIENRDKTKKFKVEKHL